MEPSRDDIPAKVFRESFKQLQLEMRANCMSKQIREFTGEGAKRFKYWLADVERVSQALKADDQRTKNPAFQSLRRSAREFLSRYIWTTQTTTGK